MPSTLPTLALRGVENTLRHLQNDLLTVTEARCVKHGAGGGTAANSTIGLLALVGVEMIASRTNNGEERDDAIRRVFAEIASMTGYTPYKSLGLPIFKLVRHGLAHRFWPNDVQLPNTGKASFTMSVWADAYTHRTVCINDVGDRADSQHFSCMKAGGDIAIQISGQHLAKDLHAYIEQFLEALKTDTSLQSLVERNDRAMDAAQANRLAEDLTAADTIALGL
ncbi:MAG: hypothetical protein Q8O42_02640 [Acidobacteriota bacterium]|nr:hypothetical protein [Acidobacteriota bacterium]